MPRILGIDSSLTSTGVCRVYVETVALGTIPPWSAQTWRVTSTPSVDRSPGGMSLRISRIIEALEPCIAAADLIMLEGQSSRLKGSSAQTLPWLWGRIVDTVVAHRVHLKIVAPSQRIKYATGKGNSQKDAVLAAAIKRWPTVDIDGNDTADALVLAAVGCRYLGMPIDNLPQSHWEPVMKKGLG